MTDKLNPPSQVVEEVHLTRVGQAMADYVQKHGPQYNEGMLHRWEVTKAFEMDIADGTITLAANEQQFWDSYFTALELGGTVEQSVKRADNLIADNGHLVKGF